MKNDKICVIGLGYVGLPLAHAFSEKYQVVGFDINQQRIDELNNGFDRTEELNEKQVKEALHNGMKFSLNLDEIKDCNIYSYSSNANRQKQQARSNSINKVITNCR